MTDEKKQPLYTLGEYDKIAQVMVYTASSMYWGEVVVKSAVRVSTWLRTNTAPDWICLYNARGLLTVGSSPKPNNYSELHVATSQVMCFHLLPPAKDPLDFDPTEPNRHMEPVTTLVGGYMIKGHIRISDSANLAKFLEVTRENFTALYDCEVHNLSIPSMGAIAVPYLIIRQESAVFTSR